MNFRSFVQPSAAILGAFLAATTLTSSASAGILYQETFDDATLPAGTNIDDAVIEDGVFKGIDAATNDKTVFNVIQPFTAPVMTFSFDVVAPVVPTGPLVDKSSPLDGIPDVHETELLFRSAINTGTDTPSSSEDINELVLQRDDGNRGGYKNNGNESIFIVVNNNAGTLMFASPVDGSTVTLNDQQSVAFIRDNTVPGGSYVQAQAPSAWQQAGPIARFAIGSGSNADQDTFSIDNVLVTDENVFAPVPEPSALALLGLGSLLALRRRRA